MIKYSKEIAKILIIPAIIVAYYSNNAIIAGICLYLVLRSHHYAHDVFWCQFRSQNLYVFTAMIFLGICGAHVSLWVITAIFAGGVINWAAMAQNGYCIEDLQTRISRLEGREGYSKL